MKVIDVDPYVKGKVRCKCCDNVMPLADVLVSGVSLVCPICGEYERFIDEMEGEGYGMANLKPCPCCGSTKIHVVAPNDGCYCWDCGLAMPKRPDWRARWNRRVKE